MGISFSSLYWRMKSGAWLVMYAVTKILLYPVQFMFPKVSHVPSALWTFSDIFGGEANVYEAGSKVDDDTLITMENERLNLLSFAKAGRLLVLNFGSCS